MELSMATNWNKLVFLFRIELSCKTNILYLILGKSLRQWIPMTQSNTKLTSFNFLSKNMRYLYHIPNFCQSTIQLDHHKKSLITFMWGCGYVLPIFMTERNVLIVVFQLAYCDGSTDLHWLKNSHAMLYLPTRRTGWLKLRSGQLIA